MSNGVSYYPCEGGVACGSLQRLPWLLPSSLSGMPAARVHQYTITLNTVYEKDILNKCLNYKEKIPQRG